MPFASIIDKYGIVPGRGVCVFDPVTLTAVTMATTAAAAGISAEGTIAGGNAAATAGRMQQQENEYQARQLDENAAGEIGTSQRRMLDTQMKTRLANSSVQAGAAASGVNAAVGSPLAVTRANASRGAYQSMLDLFEGQNKATGEENQATGLRYGGNLAVIGGDMQRDASRISALGTIAGGAGSMLRTYGAFKYPNLNGRSGVAYG